MKLKTLFMVLAFALASFAQTAAPAVPSSAAPDTRTCACCNPDQAGSAAQSGMAKSGMKCPMMSADKGAMKCPMMAGDKTAMKCPMMAKDGKPADGKMCCSSNQCPMHDKGAKGCCCGNMDQQKPTGM